jgi:uncharacterized protein (TIGR03089 family)
MYQLTPERQFAELVAGDASRPFVTYYDELRGERSELSVRSLANWVAKTHHLLVDELALDIGDRALVALPAHWISVPVLLGCLCAGLELTSPADDSAVDAEVAFVSPPTAPATDAIPEVYAISPDSAAVGFGTAVPDGVTDYVAAVRPHADAWAGVAMIATPADPCLAGLSRGEVVSRADGLPEGARLLSTRDWVEPDDWIDTVLAPVAARGSVVFVRNCADESVLERRMTQERASLRI